MDKPPGERVGVAATGAARLGQAMARQPPPGAAFPANNPPLPLPRATLRAVISGPLPIFLTSGLGACVVALQPPGAPMGSPLAQALAEQSCCLSCCFCGLLYSVSNESMI